MGTKTRRAKRAVGMAEMRRKSLLRPSLECERSERLATKGSVMASQTRPPALMRPMMVRAPKIAPWKMKVGKRPAEPDFSGGRKKKVRALARSRRRGTSRAGPRRT